MSPRKPNANGRVTPSTRPGTVQMSRDVLEFLNQLLQMVNLNVQADDFETVAVTAAKAKRQLALALGIPAAVTEPSEAPE